MQVTDGTLKLLSEKSSELKDHFVNLDREDMEDPNLAICAGVRWLFRKKEIADARSKTSVNDSWRNAVLLYKNYKSTDPKMEEFDRYLAELHDK